MKRSAVWAVTMVSDKLFHSEIVKGIVELAYEVVDAYMGSILHQLSSLEKTAAGR